jgi:hypothetical protein
VGTEITLQVGPLVLDWSKNSPGANHGILFQEADRPRIRSPDADDELKGADILWTNYKENRKDYQGSLQHKESYAKAFFKRTVYLGWRLVDFKLLEHSRKLHIANVALIHLASYQQMCPFISGLVRRRLWLVLASQCVHSNPPSSRQPSLISCRYSLTALSTTRQRWLNALRSQPQ